MAQQIDPYIEVAGVKAASAKLTYRWIEDPTLQSASAGEVMGRFKAMNDIPE